MQKEVYQATAGGLLHDIGKVIYRAQSIDSRAHPLSGYEAMKKIIDQPEILHCIRYHHKKDLSGSRLADDDLAFLVYLADNMASGADRRGVEGEPEWGFDKAWPLASIYNLLNDNTANKVHKQGDLDPKRGMNLPLGRDQVPLYTAGEYNRLYQGLADGLRQIAYTPEYVDSLLALLESYTTYMPSSTNKKEVADVSLYDHSKITAALAACLYLYLSESGRVNYKEALLENEQQFMDEAAFLMFSCDLSGIQSFIYTTGDEGALKALRARSLYLEVLLEHLVDEVLQELGLSRANLIYTGGGHAYLILPNTQESQEKLTKLSSLINGWFIRHFDNDLYLAMAWQPCSGHDLLNQGATEHPYEQIFINLSRQLSDKKSSRYSYLELQTLNESAMADAQRECKSCKRTKALGADDLCAFCSNIKILSAELIKSEGYFAILNEALADCGTLPLPTAKGEDVYLHILDKTNLHEKLSKQQIRRFYSKNKMVTGQDLATRIWMGDYHVRHEGSVATFEHLAQESQGIKRIGVLRADVDNLGQAFVSGFLRSKEEDSRKYLTISRTATLSRSLAMFFKYHLNDILQGTAQLPIVPFSLDGEKKNGPRQVNIVYSGGDDLFLVGAWQDIMECAVDIHKIFALYTQDTLTLCAGVGLFSPRYPLIRMAGETARLEEMAKGLEGKNAIALFGSDKVAHCYHWQQFEEEVVNEKLRFLQHFLGTKEAKEETQTTFVYQMLELLRQSDETINLARFVYNLARRVEEWPSKTEQQTFCDKMVAWYLETSQRQQLISAIYLYIYLYRE